jgi:transglutaminase-like putative cysteine protease
MLLRVDHETTLAYSAPVAETIIEVRKSPPSSEDQTVTSFRIRTSPAVPITMYRDSFGNRVDAFSVLMPHKQVEIHTTSIVRVHRRKHEPSLAAIPWPQEPAADMQVVEFLRTSPLVNSTALVREFIDGLPRPGGSFAEGIVSLFAAVKSRLAYEKQMTTAQTSVSDALQIGRGVCQDFAHLCLAACRGLGVPARYVSGYISQPGELETHAWCQIWANSEIGWVDIDPTYSKLVEQDHVVTAIGRDFSDVAPNRGVWKGKATEAINVVVRVQKIDRVPSFWNEGSSLRQPLLQTPNVAAALSPTTDLRQQNRSRQQLRYQQSQQQQ